MHLCPLEFKKYGSPHQVYLDAGCYAFSGHHPIGKIELYSPLLPFDIVHTDGSGKAFRLDLSLIDKIIPMRLAFVPDDLGHQDMIGLGGSLKDLSRVIGFLDCYKMEAMKSSWCSSLWT